MHYGCHLPRYRVWTRCGDGDDFRRLMVFGVDLKMISMLTSILDCLTKYLTVLHPWAVLCPHGCAWHRQPWLGRGHFCCLYLNHHSAVEGTLKQINPLYFLREVFTSQQNWAESQYISDFLPTKLPYWQNLHPRGAFITIYLHWPLSPKPWSM